MQEGRVVGLDDTRSPWWEIASDGPRDSEYNPLPRRVSASADALAALRGAGGRVVGRKGRSGKFAQVGTSAAAKQRMIERYGEVGSLLPVAREFGVSVTRLREILLAAGADLRRSEKKVKESGEMPTGVKVVLDEERERGIVARYVAGETAKALSVECGVGMGRVRELVEKYGHEWRGRGKSVPVAESVIEEVVEVAAADDPLPPAPPESDVVYDGLGQMVVSSEELVVGPAPMEQQRPRRDYVPPAIVRTGSFVPVRFDAPLSLQPLRPDASLGEPAGNEHGVLAQLGTLNSLIRELRNIEGVRVNGSVSINLCIEAGLGQS